MMSFLKQKKSLIVLLALLLLSVVVVNLPRTLTFADNVSLMIPGKIYTAHWLKQGVLPLWNPTIYGGLPWLADINQSIFYPTTLLFLLFKPSTALNLTILLHILFSAWGMYLLADFWFKKHKAHAALAIVAALLWVVSAQFVNSFNNITFLQSLTWMPFFVYFGMRISEGRKYLLGIVGMVLLQLVGGYPVHVLYSGLAAAAFSLYTHLQTNKNTPKSHLTWLVLWLGAVVVSVAVSAFVWMPFLDVLGNSTRTLQSDAQAVSGSLHPVEFSKFVVPYFFDNPKDGVRWGPGWNALPTVSLYFPWITFVLLAGVTLYKKMSRRILFLLSLIVVPILLAMGEYLPGYDVIRKFPLFSFTRGPSLILVVSALALSLLIPELLSVFPKKVSKLHNNGVLVLSALATLFSGALLWISQYNFSLVWDRIQPYVAGSLFHTFERDQLILISIAKNMFVSAVFLSIALVALFYLKKQLKIIVIAACLVLDIAYGSSAMIWIGPASIYDSQSTLIQQLPQDSQSRYLIRNYNAPYTEYGSYWEAVYVRKPFSDSYIDTQELQEFNHLQRMVDGATPNMHMAHGLNSLNAYTTLLPIDVNARWNTTEVVGINNVPEISATSSALADWAVKYYLVDTFYPTTEDFSMHTLVLQDELWKLYERRDALPRIRYEDGTALEGEIYETPNTITLKPTNAAGHTAVIIADRYDVDWKAISDGTTVEIENYTGMRKVTLKPDTQMLVLEYTPRKLYQGLGLSGLTVLIIAAPIRVQKKFSKLFES